jgi:hypothetical protein
MKIIQVTMTRPATEVVVNVEVSDDFDSYGEDATYDLSSDLFDEEDKYDYKYLNEEIELVEDDREWWEIEEIHELDDLCDDEKSYYENQIKQGWYVPLKK